MEDLKRNLRKQRVGVVTSNKMDKSIAVYVERRVKHPIYSKTMKSSKKYMAHDEENSCNIGDTPYHGNASAEQTQTLEIS
jgi:small subunit ribosomal protein S17